MHGAQRGRKLVGTRAILLRQRKRFIGSVMGGFCGLRLQVELPVQVLELLLQLLLQLLKLLSLLL